MTRPTMVNILSVRLSLPGVFIPGFVKRIVQFSLVSLSFRTSGIFDF